MLTDVPAGCQFLLIDVVARELLRTLPSRQTQTIVCSAMDQIAANRRDGPFLNHRVNVDDERTTSLAWSLIPVSTRGCHVSILESRSIQV